MEHISIPDGEPTLVKYNSPELLTGMTINELALKPGFQADGVPLEEYSILNDILPPLEWEYQGRKWRQTVSAVPATRSDVIRLQELLDRRLKELKARELGICHTRRRLYTQFLDELIRQVAIESSERGILLDRIKKEFAQTIREYEAIYTSSTAYGITKRIEYETEKEELEQHLYEYPIEVESLKSSIESLKAEIHKVRQAGLEVRNTLLAHREQEIVAMKEANEAIQVQLWAVLFPKTGGGGQKDD